MLLHVYVYILLRVFVGLLRIDMKRRDFKTELKIGKISHLLKHRID